MSPMKVPLSNILNTVFCLKRAVCLKILHRWKHNGTTGKEKGIQISVAKQAVKADCLFMAFEWITMN